MERTDELKKRVDRVKEFKSRNSSQKKEYETADFVQQGNFVMEQQLKMIIMRNKFKHFFTQQVLNVMKELINSSDLLLNK